MSAEILTKISMTSIILVILFFVSGWQAPAMIIAGGIGLLVIGILIQLFWIWMGYE